MKNPNTYCEQLKKLRNSIKRDFKNYLISLSKKINPDNSDFYVVENRFNEVNFYCKGLNYSINLNGYSYKPDKIILEESNDFINVKFRSDGLEYNLYDIDEILDLYNYIYHIYY